MAFVKTEVQGAVEIITIDRPKALNALNPEVLADLKAAFEAVDQETIRCIVLTGEGDKSFVAGADIGSMSTMTKAEGEAFGKLGNDVFLMIEHFPIPVIAAVNGFALGGGNELAMSCDIRICSDNAVFGQPEVGLGITPGFGGTQRLARLVGMGMAKQLVYSALNIKADEAYRIGLVNVGRSPVRRERQERRSGRFDEGCRRRCAGLFGRRRGRLCQGRGAWFREDVGCQSDRQFYGARR